MNENASGLIFISIYISVLLILLIFLGHLAYLIIINVYQFHGELVTEISDEEIEAVIMEHLGNFNVEVDEKRG